MNGEHGLALGRLLLGLAAGFEARASGDPVGEVRARLLEHVSEQEAAAIIGPRLRNLLGQGVVAVTVLDADGLVDALRRFASFDRVKPVLRDSIVELLDLYRRRIGCR